MCRFGFNISRDGSIFVGEWFNCFLFGMRVKNLEGLGRASLLLMYDLYGEEFDESQMKLKGLTYKYVQNSLKNISLHTLTRNNLDKEFAYKMNFRRNSISLLVL